MSRAMPTWWPVLDRRLGAYVNAPVNESTLEPGSMAHDQPSRLDGVRGIVLIHPATGYDYVLGYRLMRLLAERLAAQGNLVIRIDPAGSGESPEPGQGADLAETWRCDLGVVVRSLAEHDLPITVVGYRSGALVVAAAMSDVDALVDRVVLLDAPRTGRRYLREEHMLLKASGSQVPDDDATHVLGGSLSASASKTLASWNLSSLLDGSGVPTLVATPGGLPDGAGDHVTALEGTEGAFAAARGPESKLSVVPLEIIDRVAEWLPERTESRSVELTLSSTADAGAYVERFVDLPEGMWGIHATPAGAEARSSALMIAASSEPRFGPAGLWAIAARRLAAQGVASLRFERRGAGELGDTTPRDQSPYAVHYVDDVRLAAGWLTQRHGRRPVAVALCSAVYYSMSEGATSALERVVGFNLVTAQESMAQSTEPVDGIPEGTAPAEQQPVRRHAWGARIPQPLRALIKRLFPYQLLSTLSTIMPRRPNPFVLRAARDTDLDLIFCQTDALYFQMSRGPQAIAVARKRAGNARWLVEPELDHGLLGPVSRRRALELIDKAFGIPAAAVAPPVGLAAAPAVAPAAGPATVPSKDRRVLR